MKKLIATIFILVLLYNFTMSQQVMDRFPTFKVKTLDKTELTIPKDLDKPVNIVIIVFEQQAHC